MKHLPVAVIVLIFAGAAVWVLWPKPVGEDADEPQINEDETAAESPAPEALARLSEMRTQGIGHLENQELADAVDQFRAVVEAAPQEGLGWRNLAIAQTLQLGQQGPTGATPQGDVKESLLETARAAVEDLAKVENETPPAHYLRGKLAESSGNADQAFSRTKQPRRLRRPLTSFGTRPGTVLRGLQRIAGHVDGRSAAGRRGGIDEGCLVAA